MISETMKAIRIVSVGKAEIQTVPVPRLRGYFILVKVSHVAINPTDWYEPLT
jgi:NADPH:quinone reductase-like Zn-dependent oxidoreductase